MTRAVLKSVPSVVTALKPAAIYCRVSSPKQANRSDGGSADDFTEDKVSIPEQKRLCLEKAEELGHSVAPDSVFVDVWSAADFFERPELSNLREEIKAKKYKALIVYCVDRINRNIGHLAIFVDECKRAGCELIFVLDKIDDTPEGQMMLYLKGCVAQAERENIRRRAIMGKKARALNGKIGNAGSEKYGWIRDNGTRKRHPEQAKVVQLIFELAAFRRMGQLAIARHLNETGCPPPGSERKFKDGRIPQWHQKTVRLILTDPEYKGEAMAWKYVSTGVGKNKRMVERNKEEWIKLPEGVVEPLISPELWEMAQQVRIEYNAHYGRKPGTAAKHQALLRGFVVCAYCKVNMYPVGKGTTQHPYIYRCQTNWTRASENQPKCFGKSLVTKRADALVWEIVSNILLEPERLKTAIEKQNSVGPNPKLLEDIETCKQQIESIQKSQARYVKQLGTASDEVVELIEKELAALDSRKKAVVEELTKLQANYDAQKAKVVDYRLVANYLERAAKGINKIDHEGRVRILSILGVKVFINGRDSVEVQMLFDPNSLAFVHEPVTLYKGKAEKVAPTNSIQSSSR